MPRRKKQTDIEDAIAAQNGGHGNPGHNSKPLLSDEERRALTLHHRNLYSAADALVEKAKAERKAIADQAKADLGKAALGEIKDLIKLGDEKVCKAAIDRALRLARWAGLPIGTQVSMFDVPVDDRAFEDGKAAGMMGQVCDPPRHLPVVGNQRWVAGWHEGQAALASAFKKLNYTTEPAPAAEPQPEQAAAQ